MTTCRTSTPGWPAERATSQKQPLAKLRFRPNESSPAERRDQAVQTGALPGSQPGQGVDTSSSLTGQSNVDAAVRRCGGAAVRRCGKEPSMARKSATSAEALLSSGDRSLCARSRGAYSSGTHHLPCAEVYLKAAVSPIM